MDTPTAFHKRNIASETQSVLSVPVPVVEAAFRSVGCLGQLSWQLPLGGGLLRPVPPAETLSSSIWKMLPPTASPPSLNK